MSDPIVLIDALSNSNVQAFLSMLRYGEGTSSDDGYRVMFGGERFEDFSDHPRRAITKRLGGSPITSTAAGAYQFLSRTWDGLVKQYGFKDFSPKNQDLGAVALILGRKALDDVMAGRFEAAIAKCNREWASLPGSPYGQPVVTMEKAKQLYEEYGGTYAPAIEPQAFVSQIPETPKESSMTPFVAAVLPSLIDLVPKLGKLFSSGSETAERNIKAAEIVVSAAKEAIGARNEQELMEIIKTDPSAAASVKAAIEAKWFSLEEVGGGIQAAREANSMYLEPGAPGFWMNPAFWVSMAFLLMPLMILVDMLFVHPGSYDDTLRIQIVTAILALLGIVGAYWLGTSFSSQRKSEPKTPGVV